VTKEHLAVKARYGGLYLQYEPEYWVSMVVVVPFVPSSCRFLTCCFFSVLHV